MLGYAFHFRWSIIYKYSANFTSKAFNSGRFSCCIRWISFWSNNWFFDKSTIILPRASSNQCGMSHSNSRVMCKWFILHRVNGCQIIVFSSSSQGCNQSVYLAYSEKVSNAILVYTHQKLNSLFLSLSSSGHRSLCMFLNFNK